MCFAHTGRERQVAQVMWSDKAFGIWMGHAGEDTQVYAQDEPSIDVKAFERTRVLAIARRNVTVDEAASRSSEQARAREQERIAA
jgi:hypothetical protein